MVHDGVNFKPVFVFRDFNDGNLLKYVKYLPKCKDGPVATDFESTS